MKGGCDMGGGYDHEKTKMRRTFQDYELRRGLLAYTALIPAPMPLSRLLASLNFQSSSDPTTMRILNQHSSYTPPRTAVWCVSGVERGIRSGGVEAYALRP